MTKVMDPSWEKVDEKTVSKEQNLSTLFADLKSLFKAIVLISNVLPVLTGFWLALYFTNGTFLANWDVFLLTISGSTLVMAGALILNNWYDVDIDTVMERTKNRPTVTGNFSLKFVFRLGIALSVVGLVLLAFTTIEAAVYAFIGWFTYVILYTMWSKRQIYVEYSHWQCVRCSDAFNRMGCNCTRLSYRSNRTDAYPVHLANAAYVRYCHEESGRI